jgi:hypothetical protein
MDQTHFQTFSNQENFYINNVNNDAYPNNLQEPQGPTNITQAQQPLYDTNNMNDNVSSCDYTDRFSAPGNIVSGSYAHVPAPYMQCSNINKENLNQHSLPSTTQSAFSPYNFPQPSCQEIFAFDIPGFKIVIIPISSNLNINLDTQNQIQQDCTHLNFSSNIINNLFSETENRGFLNN